MIHIVIIFQFVIDLFPHTSPIEVHADQFNGSIVLDAMTGYYFIKLLVIEQVFFFINFLVVYPSAIVISKCIFMFIDPVGFFSDLHQSAIFRADTNLSGEGFFRPDNIMIAILKDCLYRFFAITGTSRKLSGARNVSKISSCWLRASKPAVSTTTRLDLGVAFPL